MLIVVGSLLAIALGPLFFVLELAIEGLGARGLSAVIVDVVIGFLMLVSVPLIRRRAMNGIPLAIVSAIILMALGGVAGVIGGLFGLAGSLLALIGRYKTFLR
jgi:hypothetical protein